MVFRNLINGFVFIILFAIVGCGSNRQSSIRTGPQETLQKTLDTLLEANFQEDGPGLIIKLVKNDEILYQRSIGMADVNAGIPIDESTSFRLGSISKSFTALAIMKLYEHGKLSPEDAVTRYLPMFNPAWDKITIHHLLTHQSGIPDFGTINQEERWPNGTTNSDNGTTNSDIVSYFIDNPELEFEPGTEFGYSSSGYVLLAEMIASIEGIPFSDYMYQEFFEPLAMTESSIGDEFPLTQFNRAYNFGVTDLLYGRRFRATGGSSQFGSLTDMEKFLKALTTDNIIAADTLNLMLKNYSQDLSDTIMYGYGFITNGIGPAISHSGSNQSFKTFYIVNRDNGGYLIMLGNADYSMPSTDYILELVAPFLEDN